MDTTEINCEHKSPKYFKVLETGNLERYFIIQNDAKYC